MAELPENDRIAGPFIAANGQTVFPADFPLIDAPGDAPGSCVVFVRERGADRVELTLGGFTVSAMSDAGFTLTLAAGAVAGDRCFIVGRQAQKRLRAHTLNGAVRTPTLEGDAREATARAQEAARDLRRALLLPHGLTLKAPAPGTSLASRVFGVSADGTQIVLVPNSAIALAEDLAASAASRVGAEAAALLAGQKATLAGDKADLATAEAAGALAARNAADAAAAQAAVQRGLSEAAAGLSHQYRDEAQQILASTPASPSYATDAAGIAAVAIGAQYWLRTVDGLRLKTKTGASTFADYVTSDGRALILTSTNGVYALRPIIRMYVSALGANNDFTIRPVNPQERLNGAGTDPLLMWPWPKTNSIGSGATNVTVQNGDGSTFFGPAAFVRSGPTNLSPNDVELGFNVVGRRMTAGEDVGQRILWVEWPDTAVKRLSPAISRGRVFGEAPTPDRPIGWEKAESDLHRLRIRSHRGNYAAGRPYRHGNHIEVAIKDMGTFMSDPPGVPALNSYFSIWGGRICQDLNLLFDKLDSGVSVNNGGGGPTTLEPPGILCNFATQTPAQAVVGGVSHGNWDALGGFLRRFWNDASTGTIVAVTSLNPLKLRLNINVHKVADVIKPLGVAGMVEINGQELTVTAVETTTTPSDTVVIGGVNATGYGAFTGHTGGIEARSGNLIASPTLTSLYGDRFNLINQGFMLTSAGAKACHATYSLDLVSEANRHLQLVSTLDFTHPDLTVTAGFVRTSVTLAAFTDMDLCRGIYAGAPGPWKRIGKSDDSSTLLGQPDAVEFTHSDLTTKRVIVSNNSGTGKSHKESVGGGAFVAVNKTLAETYVSNFAGFSKLYGDPIYDATGATKTDMTGRKLVFDTSWCWRDADPIPNPELIT